MLKNVMKKEQAGGERRQAKANAPPAVLSPAIRRLPDGRLAVVKGGRTVPVKVRKCFPWTDPGRYFSLRDEKDYEVLLVRAPEDLSESSRRVLEEALAQAGFVLEIVRLIEVDEEYELRNWKVETRQGPRIFQTRLEEWPRSVPGGGLLIKDVAGDLYYIECPHKLDQASQKVLWAYID